MLNTHKTALTLTKSDRLLVFNALRNHALDLVLEVAEDGHVGGQILFAADAVANRVEVLPSVHAAKEHAFQSAESAAGPAPTRRAGGPGQ